MIVGLILAIYHCLGGFKMALFSYKNSSCVYILFLLLFFVSTGFAKENSLVSFESDEGKFGYKNAEGVIVIPAQYAIANDFNDCGLAAVVDAGGWRYINVQNKTVFVPFIFDNGPDFFSEGLSRYVGDGKIGFVDECGKTVIAPQFDFAEAFVHGQARICMGCKLEIEGEHRRLVGGKWSVIDKRGVVLQSIAE